MKWKKTLIFILFLLTGIVLGTLLTSLCSSVSFLNWLTIGEQIGIGVPNPIVPSFPQGSVSENYS